MEVNPQSSESVSPSPSTSTDASESDSAKSSLLHTLNADWASSFPIPWHKGNADLKQTLRKGKRPHPSDRRAFIRIVIDDVSKVRSKPSWKACEVIGQRIVAAYPTSWEDALVGEKIGNGYTSVARQLLNRWKTSTVN